MTITCSNCGASYSFHYCAGNVSNAVLNRGWGSFGAALYCPECSKTWNMRNKGRKMPGPENTIRVIDEMYQRSRKGGLKGDNRGNPS